MADSIASSPSTWTWPPDVRERFDRQGRAEKVAPTHAEELAEKIRDGLVLKPADDFAATPASPGATGCWTLGPNGGAIWKSAGADTSTPATPGLGPDQDMEWGCG